MLLDRPAMPAAVPIGTPGGNKRNRVEFRGVEKSYDGTTRVVKNLDLSVAEGEFLTLLGPSGSGKTTTLMMLAGFEQASAGEITLDGRPINHIAPEKRDIGMVFQHYALFPHMSVEQNVAFPLTVRGVRTVEALARAREILRQVGLEGFGRRRPAQMSGGQQQRVAVARALVFGPKLVLMDEPLSALDKQLREQLQYEIKRLHAELGLTIVYVTHDQTEALAMSDRVAVFHEGRIQQIDDPVGIYERPHTAFVAGFIGETNALAGAVDLLDGPQCRARLADGSAVAAIPVGLTAADPQATLCIRPERVRLQPEPGSVEVRLPAEVRDVTYLGRHARLRLRACGTDDFIVTVANDGRALDLAANAAVHIGWNAADCRAFARETSSSAPSSPPPGNTP